jgi:hypothetical protein
VVGTSYSSALQQYIFRVLTSDYICTHMYYSHTYKRMHTFNRLFALQAETLLRVDRLELQPLYGSSS